MPVQSPNDTRLITHWCRIPYDRVELLHKQSYVALAVMWPDWSAEPVIEWTLHRPGWFLRRVRGWWHIEHAGDVMRLRLYQVDQPAKLNGRDLKMVFIAPSETTLGFLHHRKALLMMLDMLEVEPLQ